MTPLQESETQFRVLAETLPQLVWTTDPDGYHDYFNRRWYEFTGLKPHESMGEGWVKAVHSEDAASVNENWHRALATGKPFECEYRLRAADGRFRWFSGRALPIRDPSGRILRWFGTCTDVDGQKRAEEALWRLDEQYRLALEAAEMGTWHYGLASGIVSWDERSRTLFGLQSGDRRSLSLDETLARIHPDDREAAQEALTASLDPRSDGRFDAEYRITRDDGSLHWVHVRGQAFFSGEGSARRAVRLSGVISDVTPRRTGEEARHLLMRELNHRVKNLFAISSGMVSMTARTAASTSDMATALRGRLGALSRAHELVHPASFGPATAGYATTLDRLVKTILEPYIQESGERCALSGPATSIGANAATSLALVLHELATNAAKYGSLFHPEGELTLRWDLVGDDVVLDWSETGGPPVASIPTFQGFGSLLARKSIIGQLGGALDFDWEPTGLKVRMRIPLANLLL